MVPPGAVAAPLPPAVVPTVNPPQTSEELTAKLQKLALERQKGQLADRLKVVQANPNSHLTSMTTFQEMNLPPHLLNGIFGMGFEKPSAIQAYSLPRILATPPMNLIAQAQSGSGKTAAFVLGMLYRVAVDSPATTQALCVTPTRELAVQIVQNCLAPMSANVEGLRTRMGVSGEMVDRSAGVGAHIVVGTPGKVCDWLKKRLIDARTVKVLVMDEADEMCNESSHRTNSLLIKKQMPAACQCLFFSATFPGPVLDFATKLVGSADKILLQSDEELVLDVIKQIWVDTGSYPGGKRQFLGDMYGLLEVGQSIVFVETRREADEVTEELTRLGLSCSVLHSKVENTERDGLMSRFRSGHAKVLIATNVLARGVDVDDVCMVVNYDVPRCKDAGTGAWAPDHETYLHRIGRTGRFGRKGTAVNLVQDEGSKRTLAAIEQHFSPGREMIEECKADIEELADKVNIG